MSILLHNWLYAAAGSAIVCSIAVSLTPEGRQRKITAFVCGLVILIAIISPFSSFDVAAYGDALAKYETMADSTAADAGKINERLSRTFIENRCEAYILDKAVSSGAKVKASVTARWDTQGFWYPYEVKLYSVSGAGAQNELTDVIEAGLGIPKERQYWSSTYD